MADKDITQEIGVSELQTQQERPSYIRDWLHKNTFHHSQFDDIKRLVALKKEQGIAISLCFPTLNEEKTVGREIVLIRDELVDKYPLIDEIAVVDSGSTDCTRKVAKEAGADFYYSGDILPKYRFYRGKGENLWKSLARAGRPDPRASGDFICKGILQETYPVERRTTPHRGRESDGARGPSVFQPPFPRAHRYRTAALR
jgi:hypothetical protein